MGERDAGVKSDETLFAIIEHLREVDSAGVTEIANQLDLAKSTVYDHLASMSKHGFVAKRGETYRLGLQFFSDGYSVRNSFDLYGAAKPVIDDLVATTGETAWLLVYENGRVIYLYGRSERPEIDESTLISSWAHVHSNSGGKAILAHLPESEVDRAIERHGLPKQTPNTITAPQELSEELAQIREQGYALNLGEDIEGIHAVSVPLLFGEPVYGALAVAGPAHRVTEQRCESEIVDQLFAARNDVELNLVYR